MKGRGKKKKKRQTRQHVSNRSTPPLPRHCKLHARAYVIKYKRKKKCVPLSSGVEVPLAADFFLFFFFLLFDFVDFGSSAAEGDFVR